MAAPTCPKCRSSMEDGFIIDKAHHGSPSAPEWAEGAPKKSFWTGLKLKGRDRHAIVTYRCVKCGYLESYATSD